MGKTVILCPLRREARALRLAVRERAEVVVCGPGPEAAEAQTQRLCKAGADLLLLCGLAGGLVECDIVPPIGRVMDQDASFWVPSAAGPEDEPGVAVLGLPEPVTTPERKAKLAESFGATLVDCESHAFARCAERLGVRWGVIRGVSDGPRSALPADIASWVTPAGATRVGYVAYRLMVQPTLIYTMIRIGWRSRRALIRVGIRAREVLDVEKRSGR